MSKRLLVVVNVYRPDLGGGVLFADLCEGLAARGFDVTVRCAYPYYPEWRDKTGANGWRIASAREGGVWVERHGLFIPRRPNALLQRLVYEASFFVSLLRSMPDPGEFDLVMVYCPLVGAVAYGALAARAAGCPLWLNVQDLSADAAAAGGIVKSQRAGQFLSQIQSQLFNLADVWSSLSPVMIDRLHSIRRRGQPVHLLPNWLHDTLARALSALPDKTGRPPADPIRLLYSGNIGTKQALLEFCRALSSIREPFEFRIQGGGGRAEEIREWVDGSGDARFSFHPLSDEAGLARALHAADLFVVTEKSGAGGSFIPSKLIPAMASATPVLAVSDSESPLGREMTTSQAGVLLSWSELPRIGHLLTMAKNKPARYFEWQRNATRRHALYDREHQVDAYAALLGEWMHDE